MKEETPERGKEHPADHARAGSPVRAQAAARDWLKLLFGRLLAARIKDRHERRKIAAFLIVSVFLLFSFWSSFEDQQMRKVLQNAQILETFTSGKISPDERGNGSAVVVYVQFDGYGKIMIPTGLPDQVARELESKESEQPTRNGRSIQTKVPVILQLRK